MKFYYQARTKTGEIESGQVEASSREAALNVLKAHHLFVTLLQEQKPAFYARKIKLFEKVSQKEILYFSKQLAIMFKSEISPTDALNTIAKQMKNELFREKIFNMLEKVEGGMSLSKALSLHPDIFSSFYVNMVRAGEASGSLSEVFSYLADYLEKEYDFNQKVRGALIYPIFLSLVFLAVIGVVIFFVTPKLSQLLAETGRQAPRITSFVLASAAFLRRWWFLLVSLAIALVAFIYFYRRTEEGRIFFDKWLLKAPFLKNFLKSIYLTRTSLNLSTLISGGLPIVQALEVTSHVVGNNVYQQIILEASEGVKMGEPMSSLLSRHPEEFPPLFIQMLVVGEKTGHLASSLRNVVDFYQKEVDRGLGNFMSLLEPTLIIVFGILVGVLMASVILPVYQIIMVSGF